MIKRTSLLLLCFTLCASSAQAAVQYVRVCTLFGANFLFLPGTNVCFNVTTGETREATEGGVWRSSTPHQPYRWVASAAAACRGGKLVDLGTIKAADMFVNAFSHYEAAPFSLPLQSGEYIESFLLSGGMTRVPTAAGNIEITGDAGTTVPAGTEFVRADNTKYTLLRDAYISSTTTTAFALAQVSGEGGLMELGTPLTGGVTGATSAVTTEGFVQLAPADQVDLCVSQRDSIGGHIPDGCANVATSNLRSATLAFTPRMSALFVGAVSPVVFFANGRDWYPPDTIGGSVTLAACVQHTSHDGHACKVTATDAGALVDCGGSSVTLPHGTAGAAGANGSNAAACSVTDNGDGSGTMTCPDGTSARLQTAVPAKKTGCNAADTSLFASVAVAALALRRRQRLAVRASAAA